MPSVEVLSDHLRRFCTYRFAKFWQRFIRSLSPNKKNENFRGIVAFCVINPLLTNPKSLVTETPSFLKGAQGSRNRQKFHGSEGSHEWNEHPSQTSCSQTVCCSCFSLSVFFVLLLLFESEFVVIFFESVFPILFFEDLFHDINSLFVTRLGNHRPQLTLPSFLLLSN